MRYGLVILGTLLLLLGPAWADEAVQATRQKPVMAHVQFEPDEPPKDMPPLVDDEAAVTLSSFGVECAVKVQIVEESQANGRAKATVKVTGIELTTTLRQKIWLPVNAPQALADHEEGHRRLGEIFYRDAADVAKRIARPYVGKTYGGEGKTSKAAREAAIAKATGAITKQYMSQVEGAAARANEQFDRITDHGRNTNVTVDDAMRIAVERAEKGR